MLLRNATAVAGVCRQTLHNWFSRRPDLGGYWRGRRTVNDHEFISYANKSWWPGISWRQALRLGDSVFCNCAVANDRFRFLVDKCFGQCNADEDKCCIHIMDIHELMFEAMLFVLLGDAEVDSGSFASLATEWAYYREKYMGEFGWKSEDYHLKEYKRAA